jgi:5-formyltetrahydrofolate cyclo-ligase
MHIQEQKIYLRRAIAERVSHITEKERSAESRSLCRRVLEILPKEQITIAGYVPLTSEVDILPLMQTLIERGDHVYLPVFKNKTLTFRLCSNISDLVIGELNIPEPPESAQGLDPMQLNITLIPARAFDREGFRLGRGNGGYDMWIRKQRTLNMKTKFWGIAFGVQIVNEVPHEEHDEKVDAIITARGCEKAK